MGDIFDPREREGRFQWPHIKAMSWYLCYHDKERGLFGGVCIIYYPIKR